MSKSWKAILGVILIFAFGWLAGALCTSLFLAHKRAEAWKHGSAYAAEMFERRATKNLQLDPGQARQVHELIMENMKERKLLQVQIQPQVQSLNRQTFQQIRALLRPDQQDRFQGNVDAFRKHERGVLSGDGLGQADLPAAPPMGAPVSGTK